MLQLKVPINGKLLTQITIRDYLRVENPYPTVMYHIFQLYDVFVRSSTFVTNLCTNKCPPNFESSTGFASSENPKRTSREPQENPKRNRFVNRSLKWEPRLMKYLYHENPMRTPWEPKENPKRTQENPKRTARVVQPSISSKEELQK